MTKSEGPLVRLTMHICRWIRRRQKPEQPGAVAEPGSDATLEPASDGGWQNRSFPSNSHRAREYAEHVDFPSAVRPAKRE